MITIEYAEHGEPISDFLVSGWVDRVKRFLGSKTEVYICVSTSIPILALKKEIAAGNIQCEDVTFKFYDRVFQANKYGTILDAPVRFADIHVALAEDTIKYAMQQRRKEKA